MTLMTTHRAIVWLLLLRLSCCTMDRRLVLHSDVDMAAAIQTLTARIEQLVAKDNQHESEIQALKAGSVGASIYTRWGRTTCPKNGTELVYNGFTAGNTYDKNGAADYICLSGDPIWGVYSDSPRTYSPYIYGAEYDMNWYSAGASQFFGSNILDHDAPCAVCRSSRQTTVMIPGRNQCYPGWTMEYAGYLVSGLSEHASPTNYACLDTKPEFEFEDAENKIGKLMYLVVAACGTLKCPPYVQSREITCAVCSK
ncbi:hypothetical protein DPMN_135926 [Dreissena polymorpha]|uniref:Short-chain collagen C4-like n=2 Tax=Dreissena polymorpha TaxID=45954 RepID=A0A9D4G2F6_DREPO|nr:hypothetical protein DPMN_135926 [Dreissena polymorpha]